MFVILAVCGATVFAQGDEQPTNSLPNPYRTIDRPLSMPEGRTWGSTSAVDIDKDGSSVWVAERCGVNTCAGSNLPSVLKFDASGRLTRSFGRFTARSCRPT